MEPISPVIATKTGSTWTCATRLCLGSGKDRPAATLHGQRTNAWMCRSRAGIESSRPRRQRRPYSDDDRQDDHDARWLPRPHTGRLLRQRVDRSSGTGEGTGSCRTGAGERVQGPDQQAV